MIRMLSSNVGFTQAAVEKTEFTWVINHFSYLSYCIGTGNRLESPIFTINPDDDMKWRLFLWPNGVSEPYIDFISASLSCLSAKDINIHSYFTLSVLDSVGKKCFEQSKNNAGTIIGSFDGFNQFLPKKELSLETNDILLDDVLTVHCELTVIHKNSIKNIDTSIRQQPTDFTYTVLNAFEQQLGKQEFSDVKLVASCGKELPAHKFVLAARSPVFAAMFTNDMKEKSNNSVIIKDLDHDSLKEMLRFMYAGRVENLDKVSSGVLAAQEKYQIDGLKKLCEKYFFTNIKVENAVEILALSIRYNIDNTKLLAEKFIRCHAKDVGKSAAFKAIDEPNLLAEIVRIITNV